MCEWRQMLAVVLSFAGDQSSVNKLKSLEMAAKTIHL